jgi:hypothetical protein
LIGWLVDSLIDKAHHSSVMDNVFENGMEYVKHDMMVVVVVQVRDHMMMQ